MIRSLIITSAIVATLSGGPVQHQYEPASRVEAVTVFPDRALVARSAQLELRPGETTLVLSDLPANLWDHSLQVSGSGPAGTAVLDVQSRNIFLESEPSPKIRELEELLTNLRHDQQELHDERMALDNDRQLLDRITQAATTLPTEGESPRPSYEEWSQLLKFNAEKTRRIKTAQREIGLKDEKLLAKIVAVERQLQDIRGRQPGRRAVKQVTIRLAADTAGPGTVTVSYTVPGASWTPTYRARLDSNTRRVALDYEAQVTNRTGDDWTQVALTLSTARPSAGGSAPDLFPWIVQELQRGQREYALKSRSADMVMAPAMAMKNDMASERLEMQGASLDIGLTSATFKVAAPATIPADGSTHKVAVTTLDLTAGLRYATTPKFQTAAFLAAQVTNNSDFPLLPGSLAAFVDGSFIANSHLANTMAGEEFDLALGVDESVEIERTLVNRFVEKVGFTNSGTRVTYEIALKLTNHKAVPVMVELAEPLPVSRHEKIIVKILEPAERDIGGPEDNSAFKRDEEGILTWTGSLAAGATREMTLKFSIEHPNDLNVTGVE